MNSQTLPLAAQAEVLRALASGRTPAAVALDLILPVATVQAIADAHGWPDTTRLSHDAGRIERATMAPKPRHDPVVALLQRGRRSRRKPTRELAARAAWLLARLADELRDEQTTDPHAGARVSPTREVGLDAKTVRAWAHAAGIDCPGFGRVPRRVVDAYLTAHQAAAS